MPFSSITAQEQARLEALESFCVLDTEREGTFDLITETLAHMLSVPHACLSLVDRERVWFKSGFGVDTPEVTREFGFCASLVGGTEAVRYIEDARVHPETMNNSLVSGGPKIRFYAGAPLCTEDGYRIGTLCAFGPEPRGFNDTERSSLVNLATLAMHELDRRRARNELERTEEALNASQRLDSLGLIASGVAHDFNNLLCAILGSTELLRDKLVGVEGVQKILQGIEDTGQRAADLAGQVLAYAGGDETPMASLDLNEIVKDTYRMARSALESHARVELELRPDLLPVYGQSTALRQVVINLLMNAAQACDGTSGSVRIQTRSLQETGDVLLSVTDTGSGMSEAVRCRIFEPFFSSKPNGRGLGLSICKRIVEQHAGSIEIVSAKGVGTTIFVCLPGSSSAHEVEPASGAQRSISGNGELILVVDDEPAICSMARACLEGSGYTVTTAEGGQQAIELLERCTGKFRAIVLDWSMPVVSGAKVLHRMSELGIELPVVLSSGHPQGRIATAETFLKKPYTRAELLKSVSDALGLRQA